MTANVASLRSLLVITLLKEVDGAVGGTDVPPRRGDLPHVFPQNFPQELTEDHVLQVGLGGKDLAPEGMLYGLAKPGMVGFAVDDAMEDVVSFDHNHEFVRQLARRCRIVSCPVGRGGMSCAPVRCHLLQHLLPRYDKSTFNVEIQAPVLKMVDVPEDVGSVSRLLEFIKQGCAEISRKILQGFSQHLVVTEMSSEFGEHSLGYARWLWLLVVDVRLKEQVGYRCLPELR